MVGGGVWWVVGKQILVLSFDQAEQFHVPKFGLLESKIMKNKFFGEKTFLWEALYILIINTI